MTTELTKLNDILNDIKAKKNNTEKQIENLAIELHQKLQARKNEMDLPKKQQEIEVTKKEIEVLERAKEMLLQMLNNA